MSTDDHDRAWLETEDADTCVDCMAVLDGFNRNVDWWEDCARCDSCHEAHQAELDADAAKELADLDKADRVIDIRTAVRRSA